LNSKISELTATNQTLTTQLNQSKNDASACQAKLSAYQQSLNEQYNTLQKMEEILEKGMADFEGKGVDVYYKNGAIHVKLQEALMFKPASSALDDSGKKALKNLADALNQYPNLKFSVIGNTDSVMYKGKGMDNWSLSTERANSVVRILRDDYKVNPARITSGGRGKYDPVASNSTPEGRAQNRRIEIILYPDYEKIYQAVQQGSAK